MGSKIFREAGLPLPSAVPPATNPQPPMGRIGKNHEGNGPMGHGDIRGYVSRLARRRGNNRTRKEDHAGNIKPVSPAVLKPTTHAGKSGRRPAKDFHPSEKTGEGKIPAIARVAISML